MKHKFIEFFTDIDGSLSFKRLHTIIFIVLFAIVIIANLFWGLILAEALMEILAALIFYGYTGIAAEKFTKRGLTSIAANDQAMLIEAQVTAEQKRVDNAIQTGQVLQDIQKEEEKQQENKTPKPE